MRPDEEGEPGLVGEAAQGLGPGVGGLEPLDGARRVVEQGRLATGGAAVVGAPVASAGSRAGRARRVGEGDTGRPGAVDDLVEVADTPRSPAAPSVAIERGTASKSTARTFGRRGSTRRAISSTSGATGPTWESR